MFESVVGFVLQLAVALGAAPVDDAMTPQRLERMLADGDRTMIVQTFRRYPAEVLPFIDSYLEGGLAMIESGKDAAEALDSFRRGIQFAELADTAFAESIFAEYAAGFGSWSPKEQKLFREGQAAYRKGRELGETAEAAAELRRSYQLAEQLGDSWGMAMAAQRLATVLTALGDLDEANRFVAKAIELNSRLQLRTQHIRSLVQCGNIRQAMKTADGGVAHYRLAWQLLPPTADDALRRSVLVPYLAALEPRDAKEAASLREEYGALLEDGKGMAAPGVQ